MDIREALVADADAIGAFQSACWEQTYRGVVPDAFLDSSASRDRAARWAERIRSGGRRVLIALRDGRLSGVVSTAPTDPGADDLPALELCTLYLDRDVHGTGLADRLLDAAIGGEDAHLLVFSVNERAKRFYARHGFLPSGAPETDPGTGLDEERWVRRAS
ncbi:MULTISPECIES: GNAT family N-acetyltransferase [unclassified Curtobacterium]|uniref:GNAT family N-acetyltransferase n=1 Tax=unclassified Curtobacterium TaxID=257496 RepID=UPI0008DE60B8|nr:MULTISPECIES: GNAT family N-acetyltransferase [unclassified Curtobacterium]WIA96247.1 GNAT family N-acetyltransferase [Curtobacterium sp. MCBA15_004]WIA99548.1 GNAT family N-acetyltransferase [Curtobacterium sp. MCBA15_012]